MASKRNRTIAMLVFAIVAAQVAAQGCKTVQDRGPFKINFELDPLAGGCQSSDCANFDMSCGAVLSIRVIEVDTGRLVESVCQQATPSMSLCDITADIDASEAVLFDIPSTMLRLEVAIWSPEQVTDENDELACPDQNIFDLTGVPLASFTPQPAFAGAVFFDASDEGAVASVPITCSDPDQIASCLLPQTIISSTVFDVEGLLPVEPEQADNLIVRAAQPVARIEGMETVFVIDGADTHPLAREPGPAVVFSAFVNGRFSDVMCSLVLENAAQAVTAISCQTVDADQDEIELDGLFLDKTRLDLILSAALLSTFPTQGLVVGRIVDEVGLALPEVTVTADGMPPSAIEYLDSSGTTFFGDRTSDSGYFIARDVPFGTLFTAIHPDGRNQQGNYIGGLVQGHATVLKMTVAEEPVITP